MDIKKITLVISSIVAVLLIYNIFFGQSSLRETKKLTKELRQQVDTLQQVSRKYQQLQKGYVNLYNDLNATREKVYDFRRKVESITESQTNSVNNIKSELKSLIQQYDTMKFKVKLDTSSFDDIDSLRF